MNIFSIETRLFLKTNWLLNYLLLPLHTILYEGKSSVLFTVASSALNKSLGSINMFWMNEWHPMTGLRDSAGRDETDIQSLPVLATTDRVTWLWGQRWNWHIVLTSSSHNWHACVVFVLHIHSASPFGSFTPYWSVRTIKKDDAVKVLHSICQQIWKTQQWPQDW